MEKKPETISEWRQYLSKALDKTQFMALATSGKEDIWVNPVYFAFTESFEFYFISEPSARHMNNIEQNPAVACAVFDTTQNAGKDKFFIGVQFSGTAQMVVKAEMQRAFNTYFSVTPARKATTDKSPEEYIGSTAVWRLVKITPQEIYVFDERYFGNKRGQVPHKVLENEIA